MRTTLRLFATSLALGVLAACSSDSDDPGPPSGIELIATTPNITAALNENVSVPITVTRSNYRGIVTLSAEALPAGVTASFAPSIPLSGGAGSATVTFNVGSGAAAGTSAIVLRASPSGAVNPSTATVMLTVVTTASVNIALAPATLTVAQSQSATSNLVISRVGGVTGNVALSVEGAPAGVTTSFLPNPATATTSALTVSVGATVVPGTYNLSVRGTGTGGTGATTLPLTVTATSAGNFAIAAVPSSVTIAQGANAFATQVNIGRTNFTGAINFTITGLPAGITPTFNPAAATGTSTALGFVVANTVPVGTYNATIRASATGLADVTIPLAVTVTAAGAP